MARYAADSLVTCAGAGLRPRFPEAFGRQWHFWERYVRMASSLPSESMARSTVECSWPGSGSIWCGRCIPVEAIAAVGASLRYLAPYSPDLNPIERAFNKFEKLLCDGATRTTETLWELCGRVLASSPTTRAAYLYS